MCNKLPLVFVSPTIVISGSTLNSIKAVIATQNGENHETKNILSHDCINKLYWYNNSLYSSYINNGKDEKSLQ